MQLLATLSSWQAQAYTYLCSCVQGTRGDAGQALGREGAPAPGQGLGDDLMPEGQQNPRLTPHPAFDQNVRMTPSRQAETCIAMYAVNALMPCEHVKHMDSLNKHSASHCMQLRAI